MNGSYVMPSALAGNVVSFLKKRRYRSRPFKRDMLQNAYIQKSETPLIIHVLRLARF